MKGTLALRGLAAFAISLCLCSSALRAATTPFSFSGAEGGLDGQPIGMSLSGGFDLDDNATRMDTPILGGEGTNSQYTSPLHQLSGTFSNWTFSGIADIHVADGPEFFSDGQENFSQDNWIVRATVSGPTVNGLTPTRLNLFYFTFPARLVGADLFPPYDPLTNINEFDFTFALVFSDGQGESFVSGRLFSIQSVPEPSTVLLLVPALAGLAAQRKWKRFVK